MRTTPTDQADWRTSINQHETFDHDSIDSLYYDWDRIGDPDGAPRAPLKFYVPAPPRTWCDA